MRIPVGGIGTMIVLALSVGAAAAQKENAKAPPGPLTITGCVVRGDGPNDYVVEDQAAGKYRVTGSQIKRYVGQRVELVGTLDTRRLKIRGGLYPSPNAAGQAGAMDPVKSAMAGQPGGTASGTGDVQLPELKVKSVKSLGGGCR